ncbi:hypothetical protein EVA_10334 [gut metagenome]|uniref:Uncharacterized protein n=1 Tax=gut metagenome TaxID=749906 RepID=J9G402_9ZZZZ
MKKRTLHPYLREHPAMMVKATQSLRSAYSLRNSRPNESNRLKTDQAH